MMRSYPSTKGISKRLRKVSERRHEGQYPMFHETRFTSRYPISWPAALLFRFSMTNQFGAVGYEQIVRVAHREIPL